MQIPGPLVRVKSVEPLEKFNVRVVFQNGETREIDLDKYLHGPIYAPIRADAKVFQSVSVVGSTLGWENGADIDPYVLYYDLQPAWMVEEKAEVV